MQEELDDWDVADHECPMVARHEAAVAELTSYDKDKPRRSWILSLPDGWWCP